ncbi:hypothetical protein ACBZ91_01420 [Vibrio natriegens]|uniref:5' nucleotidase, NT5C type n=1 Tax=Vibrio natriegens TaxID=691 RepID=UPI003557D100
MSIIAIDMDEVIADFNHELIIRFNEQFDKSIKLEDLNGIKIQKLFPSLEKEIDDMINCDSFFRDLPVIRNSQKVIEKLCEKHQVFIVSAALDHSNSMPAKLSWLNKNFPFIKNSNIVFCGLKSIVRADYLIDDHVHHFENFSGKGILFSSPHNAKVAWKNRAHNWDEIEKLFF